MTAQENNDLQDLLTVNAAQVKTGLRAAKQATIAQAIGKDAGDLSRWLAGDMALKLAVEDIAKFLAACGLAVLPSTGVVLPRDEYAALLLFAERGIAVTKARAA